MIEVLDGRYNPNNTETHRQCADCQRVLPRSEFHKSKHTSDGNIPYCKQCNAQRNAKLYQKKKDRMLSRRREVKQECVSLLGGKCARCGYDEFLSGLDFHHVDNKENEIAQLITHAAFAGRKNKEARRLLMEEVAKCVLLCANCHAGLHANEWDAVSQATLLLK